MYAHVFFAHSGYSPDPKDPEYQPMPPTPTPYSGGYQPQPAPMMYNQSAPQFATFDTGNKRNSRLNEDSLPAMPSWNTAATRRVEDTSAPPQRGSNMEMERMIPQSQTHSPVEQPEYLQNHPPRAAALSPVHERQPSYPPAQNYAPNQAYQEHDMGNGYSDDQYQHVTSPLSPAPSYYSTVPPMGAAMHRQQPQNAYDQFQHQQHSYGSPIEDRNMTSSVAPYPSSRESTQFTAQRTTSPPAAMNYNPYEAPPPEPNHGARPPSLLQVGRKPVAGSYREV